MSSDPFYLIVALPFPLVARRTEEEAQSHTIALLLLLPLSHMIIPSALYSWMAYSTDNLICSFILTNKIITWGVWATLCLHYIEINNWISFWAKLSCQFF